MSNRNTELHFAEQPRVNIKRSTFDLSHSVITTFNAADLVPIYLEEILPGDTFKVDTSFVIRMSTPIKPVMDNAYMDIYFFFVPNRLVWNHWKEFMGENTSGAWDDDETEYQIPFTANLNKSRKYTNKDIATYMGIRQNTELNFQNGAHINVLPFRAYTLIWNEWFRDQNVQAPIIFNKGDQNTSGIINQNTIADGYGILQANKFHDYYTSCQPEPQKGDPVSIGLGGNAPVLTSETDNETIPQFGMNLKNITDATTIDGLLVSNQGSFEFTTQTNGGEVLPTFTDKKLAPSNLYADLTNATAVTINQLRQAVQTQKFLERDARCGTRYIEIIKGHFGVNSPDARQQRPEYLGGCRVPINMSQVLQTSASQTDSPQGNTAAFSLTGGRNGSFTKSFTEHGYIIGLAVVRTDHSYSQGIPKTFSRKRRFDYYWPEFAHLGEQPVYNKEIFAQGTDADNEVFGYQERYAEYRYHNNMITGEMSPDYAQSLDIWHYGDDYSSQPYLSEDWIKETTANIDRTLAVQSTTAHQFQANFYFKIKATRPMPLYGVPGLMDHF